MNTIIVPIEIILLIFGILCALLSIVYKNLNEKISELEKQICKVPSTQMQADIATIKNDISWMKSKFFNGIK